MIRPSSLLRRESNLSRFASMIGYHAGAILPLAQDQGAIHREVLELAGGTIGPSNEDPVDRGCRVQAEVEHRVGGGHVPSPSPDDPKLGPSAGVQFNAGAESLKVGEPSDQAHL